MHARAVATVLALVMALAVAACGTAGGAPATTPSPGGFVTIRDAWIRAREAGGTTAAYLSITNGRLTEDRLLGVSAPEVTNDASLHETTSDGSGMTGMQHVPFIAIRSGQTVRLEPGGYHIMLLDLLRDLVAGERVTLTMTFEQTGPVEVTAEVRAG